MGKLARVSSEPVYSRAWFKTSSWLNKPHRATITSLPVTPWGRMPVNVILAIGGILAHPPLARAASRVTHRFVSGVLGTTSQTLGPEERGQGKYLLPPSLGCTPYASGVGSYNRRPESSNATKVATVTITSNGQGSWPGVPCSSVSMPPVGRERVRCSNLLRP